MIRHGAGLRDVQVLLGHRSLKSTETYTVLTANDLKDLHARFHPREKKYYSDEKFVKKQARMTEKLSLHEPSVVV